MHLKASLARAHFQLYHRHIGGAHFASTSPSPSSTPFPFPAHRNPAPHQVFHLPSNASQAEIKSRYYELVRTYHPDSPASQALPSSVRHARFHAVTKAYDILRGRSNTHLSHNFADDVYSAELSRRRHQHARRQAYRHHATSENAEAGGMSGADDAWKDQLIIVIGLASIVVGFAPALLSLHTISDARHRVASANLAQARAEARAFGNERRTAIRARVAEFEHNKGREESSS